MGGWQGLAYCELLLLERRNKYAKEPTRLASNTASAYPKEVTDTHSNPMPDLFERSAWPRGTMDEEGGTGCIDEIERSIAFYKVLLLHRRPR